MCVVRRMVCMYYIRYLPLYNPGTTRKSRWFEQRWWRTVTVTRRGAACKIRSWAWLGTPKLSRTWLCVWIGLGQSTGSPTIGPRLPSYALRPEPVCTCTGQCYDFINVFIIIKLHRITMFCHATTVTPSLSRSFWLRRFTTSLTPILPD